MPARAVLLCSASPRRRSLLEALGHRVVVAPLDLDEAEVAGETPDAYLQRIVERKLLAARAAHEPDGMRELDALLVADTIVIADPDSAPRILHKPQGDEDAAAMIARLAGRTHDVVTRFAIVGHQGDVHVESVRAQVTFRALGGDEIAEYVACGEGRDKAGGYAIQGRGAGLVRRIEGSFGAVVGLPSCEVEVALRALGRRNA